MSAVESEAQIVALDNVTWTRGGREVISNVSWSVRAGERWALLGPNGSGKSSLLRLAAGYVWPTRGVVRRLGRDSLDLRELRRSIGWVSQEVARQIPPHEAAVDTVLSGHFAQTGLRRFGASDTHLRERAQSLLEETGCGGLAGRAFGVLSHGERQQVLVARARMARPLLIVLDEPCGGMDPGVRERFLAWLTRFCEAETGAAVVLVTHHVEEILPAFSQTALISGGRIVASGPTADVLIEARLSVTFETPVRLNRSAGRAWPVWGAGV